MANPNTNTSIKLPDTYTESIPIINDNFDKVVKDIGDLSPRQFGIGNSGCRPLAGNQMVLVSLFYDRPEYDNFATLTPKYDVYVDSGTNATGTVDIDNTLGVDTVTVAVGDYFFIVSEALDPPEKPHIFIATSATTVLVGATGSCSVVAERCGDDYNFSSEEGGFGSIFFDYMGVTGETQNSPVILRPVNITPEIPGMGGGGAQYTITTSGGDGDEDDSTHLWPNGSALTSAQKNLIVQHQLNLTTTIPDFSQVATSPYTKNFATCSVRVQNNDSSTHSIYIYLTGIIFSGLTGEIFR